MLKDTVVIHDTDADGFGAAWAVFRSLGDTASYVPGDRGRPVDGVAGRHVVMVDMTYDTDTMERIAREAASLLVLDHHKTALALTALESPTVRIVVDLDHSAAVVAWHHYHPDRDVPTLLAYVEDYDIWRKSLPDVEAFALSIRTVPQTFEAWDAIDLAALIAEGRAMKRLFDSQVEYLVGLGETVIVAGHPVPVVNCPRDFSSEVLNTLAVGRPFALGYRIENGTFKISLRSAAGGLDVADIAARLAPGGGGHRNAAGAAMRPLDGMRLLGFA